MRELIKLVSSDLMEFFVYVRVSDVCLYPIDLWSESGVPGGTMTAPAERVASMHVCGPRVYLGQNDQTISRSHFSCITYSYL